jgi:MFS family permease
MAGLALGSAADSLLVVVVGGFVLQGTGFGLLRPAVSTALADSVDEHDLGMAGATERLVNQLGVVFGITILASLYASEVDRFPLAFAVGAAFAVVAAAAAPGMARPVGRPGQAGGSVAGASGVGSEETSPLVLEARAAVPPSRSESPDA